ncbi:MAG: hypothetical protein ACR2PH_10640, partial [Desulfobulbia bacterium]
MNKVSLFQYRRYAIMGGVFVCCILLLVSDSIAHFSLDVPSTSAIISSEVPFTKIQDKRCVPS